MYGRAIRRSDDMKLIPINCRSCGRCNQLPAVREFSVFRCERCRQLNKLNLTHRLALMREAEHHFPTPTLRQDHRAHGRR
jgi:hypothetical protein